MTSEELLSKFRACTGLAISNAASERALQQIRSLETLGSIRPLVAQLRGGNGTESNFRERGISKFPAP